MSDGEIFNTITNGKNTMMAYGPNIVVADRWAIIAYLRALQRSQNATAADVPPKTSRGTGQAGVNRRRTDSGGAEEMSERSTRHPDAGRRIFRSQPLSRAFTAARL